MGKLDKAHSDFAEAMYVRLKAKQKSGFSGWDEGSFNAYGIPKRMHDKVLDVLIDGEKCNPKDLIDIANFAMFLYQKRIKRG